MSNNYIWTKYELENNQLFINQVMNSILNEQTYVFDIENCDSDKLLIIAKSYYHYELYEQCKLILDILNHTDNLIRTNFDYNYLLLSLLTKMYYRHYVINNKLALEYIQYAKEIYNTILYFYDNDNTDDILYNENKEYVYFIKSIDEAYLTIINKIENDNRLIELIKNCNYY